MRDVTLIWNKVGDSEWSARVDRVRDPVARVWEIGDGKWGCSALGNVSTHTYPDRFSAQHAARVRLELLVDRR